MSDSPAIAALRQVLDAKPGAVRRAGQENMALAVERALDDRTHLLVEAGTGTGKSLAYLVPALVGKFRVVVATATKNLQNQLADGELPFLQEHLDPGITWAVVKGRGSYACMAKLVERFGENLLGEGLLFADDDRDALVEIKDWALGGGSGDRDDLPKAVEDEVWRSVSVSGMECPGRSRCPQGSVCFAEAAHDAAANADVIVTNHHLYGLDVTSGGNILPEHDVVVFDEAHRLEDAMSNAFGVDLSAGRFHALANNANRLVDPDKKGGDPIGGLRAAAEELRDIIDQLPAERLDPGEGELGTALRNARRAADNVGKALVKLDLDTDPDVGPLARVKNQLGHVVGDIDLAFDLPQGYVAWAEPYRGVVRVSPIEVGTNLAGGLLTSKPTIMTSATMTIGGRFDALAARLGFLREPIENDPMADDVEDPIPRTFRGLAVEGSFDYMQAGLLYIAAHLPDPRAEAYLDDSDREMEALVDAAGGRALVLTTSYAAMRRFAEHLRVGKPYQVLMQGEVPKRQLLAEFSDSETSVLVATMGFWEGIDIPGPALSLVVLDKIPFARPDDPLHQARREAVEARGLSAFDLVDLPRAAMLMAQGAGRLIRGETDRGVVAVLDRRLVSMRYGIRIIRTMPQFARTTDRRRAFAYLSELTGTLALDS
jgi:ATP-dependent DNA helicase DinG